MKPQRVDRVQLTQSPYTRNFLLPDELKPYLPAWWPFRGASDRAAAPRQRLDNATVRRLAGGRFGAPRSLLSFCGALINLAAVLELPTECRAERVDVLTSLFRSTSTVG
jgi:hypothetical protein